MSAVPAFSSKGSRAIFEPECLRSLTGYAQAPKKNWLMRGVLLALLGAAVWQVAAGVSKISFSSSQSLMNQASLVQPISCWMEKPKLSTRRCWPAVKETEENMDLDSAMDVPSVESSSSSVITDTPVLIESPFASRRRAVDEALPPPVKTRDQNVVRQDARQPILREDVGD